MITIFILFMVIRLSGSQIIDNESTFFVLSHFTEMHVILSTSDQIQLNSYEFCLFFLLSRIFFPGQIVLRVEMIIVASRHLE